MFSSKAWFCLNSNECLLIKYISRSCNKSQACLQKTLAGLKKLGMPVNKLDLHSVKAWLSFLSLACQFDGLFQVYHQIMVSSIHSSSLNLDHLRLVKFSSLIQALFFLNLTIKQTILKVIWLYSTVKYAFSWKNVILHKS